MTVMLPRTWPSPEGKPLASSGTAEALRAFARDLAAGRRSWNQETSAFFTAQFDQLASTWDTDNATGRDDFLRDALERGGPFPDGPCLELGSGTGLFTPALTEVFPCVPS